MRLTDFRVLTFDCYGTLIDWESGIHTALQPLLRKAATPLPRDAALETFARHESAQEAETPAMIYSDLLATVHRRVAAELELPTTEAEDRRFGASVPDWPAFPDSASSLQYLKKYYQLVILSNVDRASFSGSNQRLGVEFDAVYTAQDVGSYKPDLANFDYMLEHLKERGLERADILHTAQSLFHDHAPAKRRQLTSAWIDRRHEQDGWGATMPPPDGAAFDFRFASMADMVKAHQDDLRA
jgi:2-haloalkanoic acid dehalogenase type II